jgi:hypothetical protein
MGGSSGGGRYGTQRMGDFEFRTLSCFELGVPHIRKADIEDQPYVMITKAYELDEIYERWGVEVEADTQGRYGMLDERMTQVLQGGMSPTHMPSSSSAPKVPTAIVKETWIKPSRRAPDGLILITAGGQILDKRPWPQYLQRQYPFAKIDYTKVPGSFWSKGMVQALIPLQRRHNRAASGMVEQVNLHSSVGVALPRGTQVKGALGGKSTIYEMPPGSTQPAHNVQVPEAGELILREIELTRQSVSDITFMHEVCVDTETHALTRHGWKPYEQLSVGQEILTYNTDLDRSEWAPIEDLTAYEWDGPAVRFSSSTLDALVTPNHSWPIENSRGNVSMRRTVDLPLGCVGIPKAREVTQFPENPAFSDELVEIVGWYVTEGNYQEQPTPCIRISQSESANPEKCERIRNALKALGFFQEHRQKDGTTHFRITDDNGIVRTLRKLCDGKTLTFEFANLLTKPQAQLLVDTLIDGDGCRYESSGVSRARFDNTDRQMVEVFSYLLLLLGYTGRVKTHPTRDGSDGRKRLYTCHVGVSRLANILKMRRHGHINEVHYQGTMWCPTTRNATFYARRNGTIYATGNSKGTTPPNVRSGTAINSLKEMDDSASSIPIRSIERAVQKQGNIILSMARQLWSDQRVVTVLGEEGDIEARAFIRGDQIGGNFWVQPGSGWPFSKAEKEAEVYRALEYGLIDQSEASRVLEMGGLRKVFNERQIDLRHARRENQLFEELTVANPDTGEIDLDHFQAQVEALRPADWHEHLVHLQVHNRMRKMAEFEQWPTYRQYAFTAHITAHQAALQAQMVSQQPQASPGQATQSMGQIWEQQMQNTMGLAQQQAQGQQQQQAQPQQPAPGSAGGGGQAPGSGGQGEREGQSVQGPSPRGEGAPGRQPEDQPDQQQGGEQ